MNQTEYIAVVVLLLLLALADFLIIFLIGSNRKLRKQLEAKDEHVKRLMKSIGLLDRMDYRQYLALSRELAGDVESQNGDACGGSDPHWHFRAIRFDSAGKVLRGTSQEKAG